jgi:FkbM family methyltransferase
VAIARKTGAEGCPLIGSWLPLDSGEPFAATAPACVGVFSIFAAKRTRNMVYVFEPFPDNCDIFTHVLTINHLSNVILQQVAVSDCTGSASLQVSSVSGTRHFLGDQQVLQTLEDYQKKDEHHPFAEVMPGTLSDTLEVSPCALTVSHNLVP